MNNEIKIYYKTVYGNDLCYPACENSRIFTDIIGYKTLSSYALDNIKKLGYKINIVAYNPRA